MVFDASLFNMQHYKVGMKGKVEQSKERSSAVSCPTLKLGVVANEKRNLRVAVNYSCELY